MNVTLFTTHCPRCKVLGMKLNEKGIKYQECTDVEEMLKLNMMSAPYLKIDNELLDFSAAIKWLKEQ